MEMNYVIIKQIVNNSGPDQLVETFSNKSKDKCQEYLDNVQKVYRESGYDTKKLPEYVFVYKAHFDFNTCKNVYDERIYYRLMRFVNESKK